MASAGVCELHAEAKRRPECHTAWVGFTDNTSRYPDVSDWHHCSSGSNLCSIACHTFLAALFCTQQCHYDQHSVVSCSIAHARFAYFSYTHRTGFTTATDCGYVGLQAIMPTVGLFARMECYWELRSKNAQNKALMCPLCLSLAHSGQRFNVSSFRQLILIPS